MLCLFYISSSWVERSLHAKFQLPRLPGRTKTKQNSVELEASLAQADVEVGAEAKADQYPIYYVNLLLIIQTVIKAMLVMQVFSSNCVSYHYPDTMPRYSNHTLALGTNFDSSIWWTWYHSNHQSRVNRHLLAGDF